jgi:hypothetical protein
MKRRISALVLALMLCMSLVPASVRAAGPAVVPSAQNFVVDGKTVKAEIYNIDGSNYFKLRDIAMLLKDTKARFSVDYDAKTRLINLIPDAEYVPDGSELKTGTDKSSTCVPSTQGVTVQGEESGLRGYNIGGNNFFKLRDLGTALGFYVGYEQDNNTAYINSAYFIERTDYSDGLPVSCFFEKPRFNGNSDILIGIEEKFDMLEEAFAADHAESIKGYAREALEGSSYPPTAEAPYLAEWHATVYTCTDDLISIGLGYDWYAGGVYDYGMSCYNFSGQTGATVYLTDVVDGTEDEIKETIITAMLEQYADVNIEEAGIMMTPMEAIREKNIEDFCFYVLDGYVHVFFSKYEITFGAAGAFDVVLPEPAQTVTKG